MITIYEASKEIINEHPEKNYSLEYVMNKLTSMGGELFICSDEMWYCYGKKKLYNTILRENHKDLVLS